MEQDRQKILQMLAENKIGVEQASVLLEELHKNAELAESPAQSPPVQPAQRSNMGIFLLIIVLILLFVIGAAAVTILRENHKHAMITDSERLIEQENSLNQEHSRDQDACEPRAIDAPPEKDAENNEK